MPVVVCWYCVLTGDGWGVSGGYLRGVWVYLSGIPGNQRCLDMFGGNLGSQSLQYGAKTVPWRSPELNEFCSCRYIETSKYQNVHI